MRVLVTGHTGFKGYWLSRILEALGHEVYGFSLKSRSGFLFQQSEHEEVFGPASGGHQYGDVTDLEQVRRAVKESNPEVIFHLAAQSKVRLSYEEPISTFRDNIAGTLNVLHAATESNSVKSLVVATTDKVYGPGSSEHASFHENSALRLSRDPYSSSKTLIDQSLVFLKGHLRDTLSLTVIRAGNVIGAGDLFEDRLMSDVTLSLASNREISIRNPNATRPWQDVMDCAVGYLSAAGFDMETRTSNAWNVGPTSSLSVKETVELSIDAWEGATNGWAFQAPDGGGEESLYLMLDAGKLRSKTGWMPIFTPEDSISRTIAGNRVLLNLPPLEILSWARKEVDAYLGLLSQKPHGLDPIRCFASTQAV